MDSSLGFSWSLYKAEAYGDLKGGMDHISQNTEI
jgi:hypothetical protein